MIDVDGEEMHLAKSQTTWQTECSVQTKAYTDRKQSHKMRDSIVYLYSSARVYTERQNTKVWRVLHSMNQDKDSKAYLWHWENTLPKRRRWHTLFNCYVPVIKNWRQAASSTSEERSVHINPEHWRNMQTVANGTAKTHLQCETRRQFWHMAHTLSKRVRNAVNRVRTLEFLKKLTDDVLRASSSTKLKRTLLLQKRFFKDSLQNDASRGLTEKQY